MTAFFYFTNLVEKYVLDVRLWKILTTAIRSFVVKYANLALKNGWTTFFILDKKKLLTEFSYL